jgi:hypothetical protein
MDDNITSTCFDLNAFLYLRKWVLSINKNYPDIAVIAGQTDSLCFWNMKTHAIQVYRMNRPS